MKKTDKFLKKYKYNIFKIIITILIFPYIFINSKINFKKYKDFCYTYPRIGKYNGRYSELVKLNIDVNTLDYHLWDLKKMNMKLETFSENQIEKINLSSEKGNVSCLRMVNTDKSKWVIGLHGWTENKYLALRFLYHYYQQGYSVLSFDAFAHGESYGEFTDIGFSSIEMIDLIIFNLKSEYPVKNIGLIGVSMGASTSVFYSQKGIYKNDISWVIADCGFSAIKNQYRYYIEKNFLKKTWWIVGFGYTKWFSKITKTNQDQYNLLKKMKLNLQTPIFFIHGIADNFIPYQMSLKMYNEKIKFEKSKKSKIWLPEKSDHIYAIADYNKEYIKKTIEFSKLNENKNFNWTK